MGSNRWFVWTVMRVIAVAGLLLVAVVGCSSRSSGGDVPVPLAIVTDNLPDAAVNEPYSVWLKATGGKLPYTWSIDSGDLPAGLDLASNGWLNGTPTEVGTFVFTVKVTDSNGDTVTKELTLVVVGPLTITTDSLPAGVTGVDYEQSLEAAGGNPPYTWTIVGGALPDGLDMSPDGVISGIPTDVGTFDFTVQVEDADGETATKDLSITIGDGSPQDWVDTFDDESKVASKNNVVVVDGKVGLEPDGSTSEQVDQYQYNTNGNYNASGSGFWVGQTFTAGLSGKLTRILVQCDAGGDVTLQVTGGGASALAFADAAGLGWHEFVLSDPPEITAGTQYEFRLTPSTSSITLPRHSDSSSYLGGELTTSSPFPITGDLCFETNVMQFTGFVSDTGTISSVEIAPASMSGWIEFSFMDNKPFGTDITYTVEAWNSVDSQWETPSLTDASGNPNEQFDDSPVDLSSLDASVYTKLRLKAALTTSDVTNPDGPAVDEWKVAYVP